MNVSMNLFSLGNLGSRDKPLINNSIPFNSVSLWGNLTERGGVNAKTTQVFVWQIIHTEHEYVDKPSIYHLYIYPFIWINRINYGLSIICLSLDLDVSGTSSRDCVQVGVAK